MKLHHPSTLSPNKSSPKKFNKTASGALERASARPDPLAHLLQDCGISASVSPSKKFVEKHGRKPKMRHFGVQCKMKTDEAETLRASLKARLYILG